MQRFFLAEGESVLGKGQYEQDILLCNRFISLFCLFCLIAPRTGIANYLGKWLIWVEYEFE